VKKSGVVQDLHAKTTNLGGKMAISKVQQFQINGSISSAIDDSLDAGSSLAGQLTLKDDLNALRSQMKRVIGKDAWYSALDGSQDLADIYAAMRVTGAATTFQGDITVGGNNIKSSGGDVALILDDADVSVAGDLTVGGNDIKSSGGAVALILDDADVSVAGDLTVGGNDIKSSGGAVALTLADADVSVAGALNVGGGFGYSGVTISSAGNIQADGDLTVSGETRLNGGLMMDNNKFMVADDTGNTTIGGTLGVTGATTLSSALNVMGAATLDSVNAGMRPNGAAGVAISSTGNIQANGDLTVEGNSRLLSVDVGGGFESSGVTISSAGNIQADGDLTVRGAAVLNGGLTMDNNKFMVADDTGNTTIGGTLDVVGASTLASVTVVGAATVNGATTLSSTLTAGASTLSSLVVTGNAEVQGDLLVQGSLTYIETDNMKVKDAFIYLATGADGSADSGLVLSKGAGSSWDLVVGQDGGAGEIIFAQVAHNADGTSPADLNGSSLVPAWLSNVKLGSVEGSLNGSLAASAAGIELTSPAGKDIAIAATSALSLGSNGNAAINFADAAQAPSGFSATTIVGMLNELRSDLDDAETGGSLAKASYTSSDFEGNVLSFSAQATLPSADHKLVDVYLNGVLMSPSRDLTAISTTSVTFDASLVSELTPADVIVVITRG